MSLQNQQLQQTCDGFLTNIFERVKILQEQYRTDDVIKNMGSDGKGNPITRTYQRGKYFQLLGTHSVIPADGVATAPDLAAAIRPSDQTESLASLGFEIPATMPCAFSVIPYQSSVGWGFTLTAQVVDAGAVYQRVMNLGDEAYREADWHALQLR